MVKEMIRALRRNNDGLKMERDEALVTPLTREELDKIRETVVMLGEEDELPSLAYGAWSLLVARLLATVDLHTQRNARAVRELTANPVVIPLDKYGTRLHNERDE